jgi:hypothetical protein
MPHHAGVAELADAQGLGPCGVTPVEVQVLSPAPKTKPREPTLLNGASSTGTLSFLPHPRGLGMTDLVRLPLLENVDEQGDDEQNAHHSPDDSTTSHDVLLRSCEPGTYPYPRELKPAGRRVKSPTRIGSG